MLFFLRNATENQTRGTRMDILYIIRIYAWTVKTFWKTESIFLVKHYSSIYHCAFLHLHPQLSHPPFVAVWEYQVL